MTDEMLAREAGHAGDACEASGREPGLYPPILLIRHGETQWNRQGRLQGRRDAPLTLNGMRQCLAVAATVDAHMRTLPGDVCFWVSPLGRARQTASILADCWQIGFDRFIEAPDIAERAYGAWEGNTLSDVETDRPEEFRQHAADPWGYRVPGGESKDELFARIEGWLDGLDPHQAHVVVTHSGCFRAIRALCTGASRAATEAYREPQTTAFLLQSGSEREVAPPAALLQAFGVGGSGRTVEI
ncbi:MULTISPECIES: histidine phosphatase family protein [Nitratireductor]|uniref:histidine phosphatase family protein n=1 Tax=Nitratireductor TaxID=245876 RepID=UPI001CD3B030|nr:MULTISPECIES: histidine phosphatase family protein [Nitratireductor]MCA1259734.1 histidine phosphatase family protein [Nitratireductor aquimarinus]MDJ1463522.1 histidine phosphatase family protein [Nitratireductor sp. GZWM139]